MTSGAFDAALDQVWADVRARPMPDDAQSPNNRLLLDGARASAGACGRSTSTPRLRALGLLRPGVPLRRQAGHAAHLRAAGARRRAAVYADAEVAA
jgi:hypothetical protein